MPGVKRQLFPSTATAKRSRFVKRYSYSLKRGKANSTVAKSVKGAPHPPPSNEPVTNDTIKTFTVNPVAYTAGSSDCVCYHLDTITQGTGDGQYLGAKFRCKAIHLKGVLEPADVNITYAGFYVVWDRQPNQALATYAKIFNMDPVYSFIAASTTDRFQVLHHKAWVMGGSSTSTPYFQQSACFKIDEYIKIPKECVSHCVLGTTDGAIDNRISGALLLVPYSSHTIAGGNYPVMNIARRIYFEDC